MSFVDQARTRAKSFMSNGCDCARDPGAFAKRASSQIKSAGRTESAMTGGTARSFSPMSDRTVADHKLYGFGGEQTRIDRRRADDISSVAQNSFYDGLDQIKVNRQEHKQRMAYHDAALDEIYKSIGISPRGDI